MAIPFEHVEVSLNLVFSTKDKVLMQECLVQLIERLDKVTNNPGKKKMRNINITKETFVDKIACVKGAVPFLKACGFGFENGDTDHLVLTEAREHKLHLLKARRLVKTRAMEDANMTEDELMGLRPIVAQAPIIEVPLYVAPVAPLDPKDDPYYVEEVNFDDDDTDLLPSYNIVAAPKAKVKKEKPKKKSPPVPLDDATIDGDFFQWSNHKLRPGGKCDIAEISVVFAQHHREKGKQTDPSNPYEITLHDAEMALWRWNSKYTKCELLDDQYFGFMLYVYKAAPFPPPTL